MSVLLQGESQHHTNTQYEEIIAQSATSVRDVR